MSRLCFLSLLHKGEPILARFSTTLLSKFRNLKNNLDSMTVDDLDVRELPLQYAWRLLVEQNTWNDMSNQFYL